MTVEGFAEYKRREFCKDVKCPVQVSLDKLSEGSTEYETTRHRCSDSCLYTTWQFHHWLIDKGYVILVKTDLKANERTVLINLDKDTADWVDRQVAKGKFKSKDQLVADAIGQFKSSHLK